MEAEALEGERRSTSGLAAATATPQSEHHEPPASDPAALQPLPVLSWAVKRLRTGGEAIRRARCLEAGPTAPSDAAGPAASAGPSSGALSGLEQLAASTEAEERPGAAQGEEAAAPAGAAMAAAPRERTPDVPLLGAVDTQPPAAAARGDTPDVPPPETDQATDGIRRSKRARRAVSVGGGLRCTF